MKVTPGRIAAALAVLVAASALGAAVATISFGRSDRICNGVTVSGFKVGGLTRTQAERVLNVWSQEQVKRPITLTALDARWSGTLGEFGTQVDVPRAVEQAYLVGRQGGIFGRVIAVLGSSDRGKRITAPFVFNQRRLKRTIARLARRIDKPHQDAKLDAVDGRLQIKQDSCGIKVNREKAVAEITRQLSKGLAVVALPVEVDRPDVTVADTAGIDTLVARFTTAFNAGKRGRTHNLTLAANALDGAIVRPGAVFSCNKIIGPRLESRGFKEAIVFVKGKQEPGLGGGVCQVSSTLYNAVLLAGLDVIERSHHSRTVPYVGPGRDATVAYGLLDFRFRNTNAGPIGIITTVKGSHLTVDVYGSAGDKRDIRIVSSVSKYVGAGSETVTDASLAPGARRVVEKGSRGVSVAVYRETKSSDGTVTKELVSRDRYPAQNRVIAVSGAARVAERPIRTAPANASMPETGAKTTVD